MINETYFISKGVVISGEGIKRTQLLPTSAELFCRVARETTNVCPNLCSRRVYACACVRVCVRVCMRMCACTEPMYIVDT